LADGNDYCKTQHNGVHVINFGYYIRRNCLYRKVNVRGLEL